MDEQTKLFSNSTTCPGTINMLSTDEILCDHLIDVWREWIKAQVYMW